MAIVYKEQVEHMDFEEMQEVHEEEIDMLNEVEKLAMQYKMNKTNMDEFTVKLDEYVAHVKAHFENEEKLMQKYDFPKYDMHKTAHDIFLMDLQVIGQQWHKYGSIDKVLNFLYKSPEWIILHIKTVDAPTATFLAQKIAKEESK